jgi:hypothetical protein
MFLENDNLNQLEGKTLISVWLVMKLLVKGAQLTSNAIHRKDRKREELEFSAVQGL